MSKFDVNYDRLAVLLLPMCLRKKTLTSLLSVLVKPVQMLHAELTGYRQDKRKRLTHNGQTCKLRALLTDRYGRLPEDGGKGIDIEDADGDKDEGLTIYLRAMRTPVMLAGRNVKEGQVQVFMRGFGGITGTGFWVCLPGRLRDSEAEVRAIVNTYKLAGVKYGIKYNS